MNQKLSKSQLNQIGRGIGRAMSPKIGINLSTLFGVLAVLVSWFLNKSVFWAIVHYFFGWIYLIYALIIGTFKDEGYMDIINFYI